MVIGQDWSSYDCLSGRRPDPEVLRLGYTPSLPTNKRLDDLLARHFGLSRSDCYLTNLFPFLKRGDLSAPIRNRDLVKCALGLTHSGRWHELLVSSSPEIWITPSASRFRLKTQRFIALPIRGPAEPAIVVFRRWNPTGKGSQIRTPVMNSNALARNRPESCLLVSSITTDCTGAAGEI